MEINTIWQDFDKKRVVTRASVPSEATLKLLRSTIWGSRSTKYRILNIDDKLARLRDPSFFVLSEDSQELSVFVLDKCSKILSGKPCAAFHFAMASTVSNLQNQGLAGVLIEQVRNYCQSSLEKPGLGFAYVEATTEYSLRLSEQIGHSIEADVPLTLFTRLFPRNQTNVEAMKFSEIGVILETLERMYAGHELTDFSTSVKPEEFFVLRENGTIAAGAQVEVLQWSMVSMPGVLGHFIMSVLPHLPGLNSFLDIRQLRIARLSNLFFANGRENAMYSLLEACLFRHKAKIGLIMLDRRSPILHRIQKTGKMGLLSHAINGSAKLRIDTLGMDEAMMSDLAEKPLLVSSADVL